MWAIESVYLMKILVIGSLLVEDPLTGLFYQFTNVNKPGLAMELAMNDLYMENLRYVFPCILFLFFTALKLLWLSIYGTIQKVKCCIVWRSFSVRFINNAYRFLSEEISYNRGVLRINIWVRNKEILCE